MRTKQILLLLLLALPVRAQLVFDQNPRGWKAPGYQHFLFQASTAETACQNIGGGPVSCFVGVVIYPRGDGEVMIHSDAGGDQVLRGAPLRDGTPTLPALPLTSGPVTFSGTWKYAHNFGPGCRPPIRDHPNCMIPALDINVGDSYSGSLDFDLDGNGQPINVSVSFTLSEP